MTRTEALKLALEALELHGQQYPHMVKGYCLDAIATIKEVLAQPEQEQEPVAWMDPNQTVDSYALSWYQNKIHSVPLYISQQKQENPVAEISKINGCPIVLWDKSLPIGTKLYTTPPQRTWVGLTDEDVEMIVENRRAAHWEFVRQVEALLKEKNI